MSQHTFDFDPWNAEVCSLRRFDLVVLELRKIESHFVEHARRKDVVIERSERGVMWRARDVGLRPTPAKPQPAERLRRVSGRGDPELRDVIPTWGEASPFDAEEAAALVGEVFDDVEVEWWEGPGWALRTRDAVVDYLVAFKVPDAETRADRVDPPVTITKSGVNVWA